MTSIRVIIPFRDRGTDPRRQKNLDVVMAWWFGHGLEPQIVDDGLSGDAPFNRHRAYNRAVAANPADVYVFTEADMLISPHKIAQACIMAQADLGLVVPFTQYRYWSDAATKTFRSIYHRGPTDAIARWWALPDADKNSIFRLPAESTMDNGRSIGAVNVISAASLWVTGGFTEATHGNWYDDRIIEEGFAYLTKHPTRYVPGEAVHLYHLPGWKGDHLSDADKAATEHNRSLLLNMRVDIKMGKRQEVADLMAVREETV